MSTIGFSSLRRRCRFTFAVAFAVSLVFSRLSLAVGPAEAEGDEEEVSSTLIQGPATIKSLEISIPKIENPKEAIVIFDWDDTLLASSYLSSKGMRLDTDNSHIDEATWKDLRELETAVIHLVSKAEEFADVHIVSNAEAGWVQLSAEKFLPNFAPLLSQITVVSARSTYEHLYPDAPLKWKYYAFQNLSSPVAQKYAANITAGTFHFISLGDSHVEREACRAYGRQNAKKKSVKFAERPSIEQLRRQVELVDNCLEYIRRHDGDLDLQLTVTSNTPNP